MTIKEKRLGSRDLKNIGALMMIYAVEEDDMEDEHANNPPSPVQITEDEEELEQFMDVIHMSLIAYHRKTREEIIHRAPLVRLTRTIDSFNDTEVNGLFRFRNKSQLHRLYVALGIDRLGPKIVVDPVNRHSCTGEEFFTIGLYRICSVKRLEDMEVVFGRDYTWICRVAEYFFIWMDRTHSHKLFDNLDFWFQYFPYFSECMRKKAIELSKGRLNYPPGTFKMIAVCDCTNQKIPRPLAGPAQDGPDAQRADPARWIQRLYYNGYLGNQVSHYVYIYIYICIYICIYIHT
jgi:hypothetical protein